MSDIMDTGELTPDQDCVEKLLKQLAAERKLRVEFEEWLEAEQCDNEERDKLWPESYSKGLLSQSTDTLIKFNELKAKHLPQNKSGGVE